MEEKQTVPGFRGALLSVKKILLCSTALIVLDVASEVAAAADLYHGGLVNMATEAVAITIAPWAIVVLMYLKVSIFFSTYGPEP
jgi:hypothetical protein